MVPPPAASIGVRLRGNGHPVWQLHIAVEPHHHQQGRVRSVETSMVHWPVHTPKFTPPSLEWHGKALKQARTQNHGSLDQTLRSREVTFTQCRIIRASTRSERFTLPGFLIYRMYVMLLVFL